MAHQQRKGRQRVTTAEKRWGRRGPKVWAGRKIGKGGRGRKVRSPARHVSQEYKVRMAH